MEKILNHIGNAVVRLPKLLSDGCKIVALFCVFYAFEHSAWHCLFTAAMYLFLSYAIKHIND